MIAALLIAFLVGLVVYAVGTFFDPTPNNRYAAIAGLIVFVLVFISRYQIAV